MTLSLKKSNKRRHAYLFFQYTNRAQFYREVWRRRQEYAEQRRLDFPCDLEVCFEFLARLNL
jgi:hypothetical protein